MAKRQNFIVGSTNGNTETQTVEQLNRAWDQYAVLHSGTLDGVFNAVSDYSNDSSNEIANAIQSITGSEPAGANQSELANALSLMQSNIRATAFVFKAYVATTAPSSSTYSLRAGDLWINSATTPTSFPIAANLIKTWNGSSWVNYGSTYTPANFHTVLNIKSGSFYFWLGGVWNILTTNLSTSYFTQSTSNGKFEISSSYNSSLVHIGTPEEITGAKTFKGGVTSYREQNGSYGFVAETAELQDDYTPMDSAKTIFPLMVTGTGETNAAIGWMAVTRNGTTTRTSIYARARASREAPYTDAAISVSIDGAGVARTSAPTPPTGDVSTKIATTEFVAATVSPLAPKASPALTGNPTAPTQNASNSSTRIATTAFVHSITDSLAPKASPTFTGTPAAPTPSVSDNSTKIATTAFVVDVLKAIYPVGSVYIGTQNTCPMSAFFGTWTLVSTGKALWTGDGTNGNTTIAAGLPDIQATFNVNSPTSSSCSGAITIAERFNSRGWDGTSGGGVAYSFKASDYNSTIYGNSTTVQPPAYVVNVWRRTA